MAEIAGRGDAAGVSFLVMNCEECKNLVGVFLSCKLDAADADRIRMHLALCEPCAMLCEDLASGLDFVNDAPADGVPPNSHALWCRINNIIESELKPPPPPQPTRKHIWRLSLGQMTAAVLSIALLSSVATLTVIRSYSGPSSTDLMATAASERTIFEKVLGRLGLAETPQQVRERRMKEQQAAIDYWNARVQTRRMQWDRQTREAFDRNLKVIDQSLVEYSTILQRDPEDELSGEMLDSVLDDKMNLLRDFADL